MAAQFAAATAVFLSCLLALAALASCNTEGDILYKQRATWKDPNDVLVSWDPTLANPCTWVHITCNNDNSVIRVMLYGNNLTGPIPESLGNLTSLERLELQRNALSGAIPSSLGNIKTLQFMKLNANMLTGTVPLEVLSLVIAGNLTELNIANNDLAGTVRSSGLRVTAIIQDKLKTT
ncbi:BRASSINOSTEROID INSENSITIVE 1-associated receptor kinase 1 [Zea mays]|nr:BRASSINOSTEROID INSENSITIVE 1-associated receptor kinase 1 [Zea mays]